MSEESALAGAWDCLGWDRLCWCVPCFTLPSGPSLQGVISVKGLVDREKGDFYTLTVVADDGGPKVDATVVSDSPGVSPTGASHHQPKAPQNPHLHQPPNMQARQ